MRVTFASTNAIELQIHKTFSTKDLPLIDSDLQSMEKRQAQAVLATSTNCKLLLVLVLMFLVLVVLPLIGKDLVSLEKSDNKHKWQIIVGPARQTEIWSSRFNMNWR